MAEVVENSFNKKELINQFLNIKDTLTKNGVEFEIVNSIPLRKRPKSEFNTYYKDYMKDKYANDPEYREKAKQRSRKAYLAKKEKLKQIAVS